MSYSRFSHAGDRGFGHHGADIRIFLHSSECLTLEYFAVDKRFVHPFFPATSHLPASSRSFHEVIAMHLLLPALQIIEGQIDCTLSNLRWITQAIYSFILDPSTRSNSQVVAAYFIDLDRIFRCPRTGLHAKKVTVCKSWLTDDHEPQMNLSFRLAIATILILHP